MPNPDDTIFEDLRGNQEPEKVLVETPDDGFSLAEDDRDQIPDEVIVDTSASDGDPTKVQGSHDGDDDGFDDDPIRGESYSQRVRDRIARERRVTAREREARMQVEGTAKALYEGMKRLHEEHKKVVLRSIDRDIDDAKRSLTAAAEAGESEKQTEASQRLSTLMADRKAAELAEFDLPEPQSPLVNEALADWRSENSWYDRPTTPRQLVAKQTYMLIDREMAEEGFAASPSSPEWFKELDARFAKQRPDLFKELKGGREPRREVREPAPRRSPVMGVRREVVARGNKVVLTREDLANMVTFKLDPKNPEHLRRYAAEKRSLASKETSR